MATTDAFADHRSTGQNPSPRATVDGTDLADATSAMINKAKGPVTWLDGLGILLV